MARGDQLSRQWKIIQTLMAVTRGKTKHDLAAELECHHRTVYRDLEALQAAGFPLVTEQRDNHTYWSIIEGNRHQMPLPLSLTELMALYFSRNMLKILQGTAIYDSEKAVEFTFFYYEMLRGIKLAADRARLTRPQIEGIFFRNALTLLRGVAAGLE